LDISNADLKMPQGTSNVRAMNENSSIYDVAVVGGGPTGLSAAIAIAQSGARTALVARHLPYGDNRTTALLGGSIDFLRALDVWPHCQDKAAELRTMRLVDDTGRLIRAPEVKFTCGEIGLDVFGYNIENRGLVPPRSATLPGSTMTRQPSTPSMISSPLSWQAAARFQRASWSVPMAGIRCAARRRALRSDAASLIRLR